MFFLSPKACNSCSKKGTHKFVPFIGKHFSEASISDNKLHGCTILGQNTILIEKLCIIDAYGKRHAF